MRQLLHPTLRLSLLTGSSVIVLIFAGCMVGPNYRTPEVQMPAEWAGPTEFGAGTTRPATRPTTGPAAATTRPVELSTWWDGFNDPILTGLIREAAEANLTRQQAASRVRQARYARTISASALWPDVNTTGSYTRSGRDSGGLGGSNDLYRAGVDASWEIDVFGGVRRSVEAADADVAVAVEDERDVRVSLVAEVALDYIDLRSFQRQIEISRSNLVAQRRSADLTRRQFQGGFVSGLDVANADAQVATTESAIPLLEASERQAVYALSVLLAREPGALLRELIDQQPARGVIPGSPPEVPVGLPSELLERRPDIRRADAQVHAATARVGVATADLFPRFFLNGAGNVSSDKLVGLANWSNTAFSIGPSVSWPLFTAGRIRANIAFQNEAAQQAALAYRQTILNALQEVESALIDYAKEQEHRRSLAAAAAANRRAVELSTTLYTQGNTDFLNVLSAQRSLYAAELALVNSDRTLATSLVALYKALGGGW
ncbi:MAG TPA: efflux transporter outer membrane subunit [Tepidisphaeraceae bacterium]|jgi:NodT family efflux transporter outer membrane factor (OMF) lipoprotein